MKTLSDLCSRVFGCRHSNMSRAFTLAGRTYQVCCDCGSEFDYSLETMSKSKSKNRCAEVLRARPAALAYEVGTIAPPRSSPRSAISPSSVRSMG